MTRPQPPSTLFPYTTLFRSPRQFLRQDVGLQQSRAIRHPLLSDHPADRKSTRLNSSHEWISYAVFCLKKKIDVADGEKHVVGIGTGGDGNQLLVGISAIEFL